MSGITVASELGRVVLAGEVGSEEDAARAVRIARAVNGVRSVVDEMVRAPFGGVAAGVPFLA